IDAPGHILDLFVDWTVRERIRRHRQRYDREKTQQSPIHARIRFFLLAMAPHEGRGETSRGTTSREEFDQNNKNLLVHPADTYQGQSQYPSVSAPSVSPSGEILRKAAATVFPTHLKSKLAIHLSVR